MNNKAEVVTGFTSPIGVAVSKGFDNPFLGLLKSLSLYAIFIDIGAITAYRFDDNNQAEFPEFKLENIIAPGAYCILGFKNSPLSLGGGIQISPSLRKVDVTDPENPEIITSEISSAYRWSIFLAVDIPLLNFYTKPF